MDSKYVNRNCSGCGKLIPIRKECEKDYYVFCSGECREFVQKESDTIIDHRHFIMSQPIPDSESEIVYMSSWLCDNNKPNRNTLAGSIRILFFAINRILIQIGVNKYKRWIRKYL